MKLTSEIYSILNNQVDSLIDMVIEQKSQGEKLDKLVEDVSLLRSKERVLGRSFIELSDYLNIHGVTMSDSTKRELRQYLLESCLEHDVVTDILQLQKYDVYPLGLLNYISVSERWSDYF